MLEAKGVSKIYFNGNKQLRVLKDVNLAIVKGELLSIVGPSGAGKSTLLHILGGLDEPTKGEVLLDGVSFLKLDDAARARIRNKRFGFVFQFYHLLREFTALENVMLPALISPESKTQMMIRDKALGLLDFLGLSARSHHKPAQLSGGEQQRCAIARAMINDPEIMFCDEPTGNLDHEAGRQIHEMLLRLNQQKKTTVVIVTHSCDLAQGSQRILQILDGALN